MTDLGEMKVKVGADISDLQRKMEVSQKVLAKTAVEANKLDSTLAKGKGANEAAFALTNLGRVAQDLPYGFIGIQNNLNPLLESFQRLKKETGSTGTALKALLSGLTGAGGVGLALSVVTAAVSFLTIGFDMWTRGMHNSNQELDKNAQSAKEAADSYKSIIDSVAKESSRVEVLVQQLKSETLSRKERNAAIEELKRISPQYFADLNTEKATIEQITVSYNNYTASILKTIDAKIREKKLEDVRSRIIELQDKGKKSIEEEVDVNGKLITSNVKRIQSQEDLIESLKKGQSAYEQFQAKAEGISGLSLKEQRELNELLKTQAVLIQELATNKDFKISTKTDASKSKREVETISEVLQKLAIQINFLNQKQLVLRTDESQNKINAIESTIEHLMQKFKLLSDNPVIITLQAQAADVALQQIFKKDAADRKNLKIELPVEPEIKFADTFNEQVLRDQLLEELTRLGIKKTIPVKIGVDILGKPIFANSEKITKFTGTEKLQATFDDAFGRILAAEDKFASDFKNTMSSTLNDTLFSIGQSVGDAIGGGQDLGQAIFGSFFQILADGIEQLGKALIALGTAKIAVEKFALTPGIGTVVAGIATIALAEALKASLPKFATGGLIRGAGSGTSDSIPAWLSNGEFVMRSDIVSKLGVGFFDKLNRGIFPKFDSFGVQKFATGGFVSPNIVRASFPVAGNSIRGGQTIYVTGEFKLRNDKLVAAVNRGNAQISRNG